LIKIENFWQEYEVLTTNQIDALERSLFVNRLQVYSFGGGLLGAVLVSSFSPDNTLKGAGIGALLGIALNLFISFW
jgi:hypothetical protein